ncbi:MAG: 50S ribosome-binding GTPase, partial [Mitsuokella jalaludinii]
MQAAAEQKPAAVEPVVITQGRYIASAVRKDQYPERELPEIVFIGRSNVGKSSLINSLTRIRGLARVSAQPGKTQTINFFELTAKLRDEKTGEEEGRKDF